MYSLFNHHSTQEEIMKRHCIVLMWVLIVVILNGRESSYSQGTGNNEVVFRNNTGSSVVLNITPKDFIFNNELYYYTQVTTFGDQNQLLALNNGDLKGYSGQIGSYTAKGFESPWEGDAYESVGDIEAFAMLGFGCYNIAFAGAQITLNTIDGNWYTPNENDTERLLFEIGPSGYTLTVTRDGSQIYSGPIPASGIINTWDYGIEGRDRNGYLSAGNQQYYFAIDGNYSPAIPISSTSVDHLTLDVNAHLYNNVTLTTTKTLEIVGISNGTTLSIEESAVFTLDTWPLLKFTENPAIAALWFKGRLPSNYGKAHVYHPLAIKGTGNIHNCNITWHSNFQIESNDAFTFHEGGAFEFTAGTPNNFDIVLNGSAIFMESEFEYRFGDNLRTIWVQNPNGLAHLTTNGAVTLSNIGDLQGLISSEIISYGYLRNGQPAAYWKFRQRGKLDIYDILTGHGTYFQGMEDSLGGRAKWDGILAAYQDAHLSLNQSVVRDIYTDANQHGSGVHLYGASNSDNEIYSSRIIRESPGTFAGDGIFIQPDFIPPSNSSLRVLNSCIYQYWATGLTNIYSIAQMIGNQIYGNYQGVGGTWDGPIEMSGNCVRDNWARGMYLWNNALAWFQLGYPYDVGGNNVITENATVPQGLLFAQIVLDSTSELYGGGGFYPLSWKNDVSHSNPVVKRVSSQNGSVAHLQMNWWGEQPGIGCGQGQQFGQLDPIQEARFFLPNPPGGAIEDNDAMCSRENIRGCTATCEAPGGIAPFELDEGMIVPPYLPIFAQMKKLAAGSLLEQAFQAFKNKDFAGAYKLLLSFLQSAGNADEAMRAGFTALHFERELINNDPNGAPVSAGRLLNFLLVAKQIVRGYDSKAAVLEILAHAYANCGDLTSADNSISTLRSLYPKSGFAKRSSILRQFIAMAARDTIGVDDAIAQMKIDGLSGENIRLAESMRLAFLRVKPRNMIHKFNFSQNESEFGGEAFRVDPRQITVFNYPNPFNPSTVIGYRLPAAAHVTLTIYSPLGAVVSRLIDGEESAGLHLVTFDANTLTGNPLPSGVYFYTLTTPDGTVTGRMNLVR